MRALSLVLALILLFASASSGADRPGRIEGRLADADGRALGGVRVTLDATSAATVTDADGRFSFRRIPAGDYTLTFTLAGKTATRSGVRVDPGSTTEVEHEVDWQLAMVETVTVTAVSRTPERIVDAPAAVNRLSADEIEHNAAQGTVPKLFEFTPGVDITQISLTEFLVNTRGFNGSLNRRMAVLADGRDLTDPFIGAMEWSTIPYPMDDLTDLELVRGPTSALYGGNATGGTISLRTKAPRDSLGGRVRLAAGELDTVNTELRWSGSLGSDWYMKVQGGRRYSRGYSQSRVSTTEYSEFCEGGNFTNCLPRESIPLPKDAIDIAFGSLRADKYLSDDSYFTIEAGTTDYDGTVFLTVPSRGQITSVKRPWGRLAFTSKRWHALAYYSQRNAEATNLNTANPFLMDSYDFKLAFQTHQDFASDRLRLVAGGLYLKENVDSNILDSAVDVDEQALYGQLDWTATRHLKLTGAVRWDNSTLFDPRFSPRLAIVYGVNPKHSLRLTYNRAFQVPTYGEFFLALPLSAPIDLGDLNQTCLTYAGVDCGLGGGTPNLLLGNESLDLETVDTIEFGYKGILGRKAFLTFDYFESKNESFVTGALPQLGPLGLTNPNFGPWQGPPEAETTPIAPDDCSAAGFTGGSVADCVRAEAAAGLSPGLLTNRGQDSIVLSLSYTNVGQVDSRGAELGLDYYFTNDLRLSFSYSWLDFELINGIPEAESVLAPNAPENKISAGLSYAGKRWDGSLMGRWVDGFRWYNAVSRGDVQAYTTFDLTANYRVTQHWQLGLSVANLLDNGYWAAWSSDLIGRRALAHVTFYW